MLCSNFVNIHHTFELDPNIVLNLHTTDKSTKDDIQNGHEKIIFQLERAV